MSKEIAEIIRLNVYKIIDYTDEQITECSQFWDRPTLQRLMIECEDLESQYNTAQMVAKILMNSLYGALGNKHFPLFNESFAQAITGNGRYFIRKLANYIEERLQQLHKSNKPYIVYGDTDSVYYHIEPFMEGYITKNPDKTMSEYVDVANEFELKVIAPLIQRCIDDFSYELNAYNTDVIGAEREIIADTAVFCAKKSYFARVRDNEGTRYPDEHPKIKVMGMDVTKSGTPKWSKKKLKEAIPKILDSTEAELKVWLRDIKHEFTQVPLSEICNMQSVNNLSYTLGEKGVPIGARSALVYNNYLLDKGLDNTYMPVPVGEKTKRIFLRKPNKFKSDIIGYMSDNFESQIEPHEVDYDQQYEKRFMNLLNLMTKSLNYKIFQETTVISDDW